MRKTMVALAAFGILGISLQVGASVGVVLTGTITEIENGVPLKGAKVRMPPYGKAVTDEDGVYRRELILRTAEPLKVVVRKKGYIPSKTWALGEGDDLSLSRALFPRPRVADKFNLKDFDHVFRWRGEFGTSIWTESVAHVELWTGVYDVVPGTNLVRARREKASPEFLALARDVLTKDVPIYTDGKIRVVIREVEHAAGQELLTQPSGVIRVAVVMDDRHPESSFGGGSCGSECSGRIDINPIHANRRGVISHEVAHIFGWQHPCGLGCVPFRSIMGPSPIPDGPTEMDAFYAKALYSRPLGSRSPDIDPDPREMARMRASVPVPPEMVEDIFPRSFTRR